MAASTLSAGESLQGDDVAGIGAPPVGDKPTAAGWHTHVGVESVDDTARRARAAGGSIVLEPFDVAPAGRLAVLEDPAGTTFCAWEAGTRVGARRINEPSAWAMTILRTPDPAGAEVFYGQLFGWAESFGRDGGLWLWRLPGYVGGEPTQPVPRDVVAVMALDRSQPVHWGVDFWVADTDAAAAQAPELGGRVLVEPFTDDMFRRAALAAPDGAVFAISQLQLAG